VPKAGDGPVGQRSIYDSMSIGHRHLHFGKNLPMLDIIFIVGGLAFFAISAGYTIICERL